MSDDKLLEKLYRVAKEAGGIGIWTWSQTSDAIVWDETARAMLGVQEDASIPLEGPEGLESLIAAADRPSLRAAITRALSPEGPAALDIVCRTLRFSDGERWLALFARVQHEPSGLQRLCGAVRDVTSLRLAEQLTSRVEARLGAIISIAADAIISLDSQQRITLFNHGAEQIFGYTAEEMIGQPLDVLLPERYRARHAAHIAEFGTSGMQSRRMGERTEIYARRKTGEEFPAEASISHLKIDHESLYTVVLRDVSERKQALDILAASHDELERRVAERTRELKAEMARREETQAQLLRTQRMEAFGQLTGGIAHDFNNLLTVITGNLELLEMRLEDEGQRRLLKRAQDASEMGARLTSRLLTFARRRKFEPALLDLNEQVVGMVDLLRRTLGEHIDLNARLAAGLWAVRADPSEVENAILNLAINARDAMPQGGRLVIETANVRMDGSETGARQLLKPGAYVRISISDTGTGMPPEVLQRSFEPFFTTKAPGRGTGLGLSTIYGFAEQSGGTATIYSEVGHGTTVNIYLPGIESKVSTSEAPDEALPPVARGELVLVVEDNAQVREVACSHLSALGYRTIEAASAPEAMAVVRTTPDIVLVFSDVVMPGGMSGFDLARWIEAEHPAIKVVLASGFAEEAQRRDQLDAKQPPVLLKPYNRAELARALRRALGDDQTRRTGAANT